MDGYVCHEVDVREASRAHPVRLHVSGEVRMGEAPREGPDPGEAWSITTGGAMPLRGDRVVPLEEVRRDGEELVIERCSQTKLHVAEPGEDLPLGAPLLHAGEVIGPAAIAALVGVGIREVEVYRRVRVALLSTGDELIEALDGTDAPPPGRIFNTNAHVLAGELGTIGCLVDYRGVVADRREALSGAFRALVDAGYDVILSTGGVSVGPYDKVPRAWLDLGVKRIVGRIDLKPGGPFFAGLMGSTWVIGLSGSPVASLATYHLLARPLLCQLSGRAAFVRPIVPVTLRADLDRRADRFRALWTRVEDGGDGRLYAHLLTEKALGILGGMIRANGLLLLRPGTPRLRAGSRLPALQLDRPEDRQTFVVPPARPAPLVVGVVGSSGGGKTTVIAGLLRRLRDAGVQAIAVKHAAHGFELDRASSDSARMLESGAAVVLVVGPDEAAIRLRLDGPKLEGAAAIDTAIAAAEQMHGHPPQIVLVEGFRHVGRPVVLVGTAKPDAQQDTIWMALPAVSSLDPQELERSLDQLAALLRERLG
jgi:molybdopterin molybdotransferase